MHAAPPAAGNDRNVPATLARWRGAARCAWLILAALVASPALAQAPRPLADLVFGAGKRAIVELEVGGDPFQGIAAFSDAPYVLWPTRGAERLPRHDQDAVRSWIDSAAAELGFAGFQARYEESWEWRGGEVWSYALQRDGLDLWRARVQVHFAGERLVGFALDVPQPLLSVEPVGADVPRDGSYVLSTERSPEGYRAAVTQVRVTVTQTLTVTQVGTKRYVSMTQPPPSSIQVLPLFSEWNVPVGTFPDQIDVDSQGKVWFSQPNNNFLTRFDPVQHTFTQFPTTGGSGPDGMRVDAQNRKWTGLYFAGGLGKLDVNGTHTAYAAPYANAKMAIPLESSQGTIWVTDHERNHVSEFDPLTSTWLGSYLMPSPASWVVEGHEDVANATVYFSCYSVNKLAYKPLGQAIGETATLGSGPAFPVVSGGKVYYSLWNSAALGEYDIQSGTHQLFTYPLPAEVGGPIAALSDGRIVVGTRGAGYIMVFEPSTSTFTYYKIPTVFTGNLKDGLTIGKNDEIWFTETFANKIARLRIP